MVMTPSDNFFALSSDVPHRHYVCMSMNKKDKQIRSISWASSVLVALLALASFSLSFEALKQLAVEKKVVPQNLGWVFPLVVDGSIAVFSMSALRASLREENAIYLRGLVIFATLASIMFNIFHVEAKPLVMTLAATPPLLLFFSFEALMHSIKNEMKIVEARGECPENMTTQERRARVLDLLNDGHSINEITLEIPTVSMRTLQRDILVVSKH